MLTWVLLKIAADISLYYTFFGPVAYHFGAGAGSLFASLALLSLSFSLSYLLREKGAMRFAPLALIAGACFLPGIGLAGRLALLPSAAYVVYLTARRVYEPEWGRQVSIFSAFWKLLLVFFVFSLLFRVTGTSQRIIVIMGTVSLVCSVLIMRSLRHDPSVYLQRRYQLTNLLTVLAGVGGAVVLSTDAVRGSVFAVLRTVYTAVATAFLWLLETVLEALEAFVKWLGLGGPWNINSKPQPLDASTEPGQLRFDDVGEGSAIVEKVVIGMILVLVALALFALFRYLAQRDGDRASGDLHRETRFSLDGEGEGPAKEERGSAVQRVRQQYRRFLKLCARLGRPPLRSDTSLEVQQKSEDLFDQSAAGELRELYLRARYDDAATKADAARARALYAELKKSAER